MGARGMTVLKL